MIGINTKKELEIFYNNLPNKPYCGCWKGQTIIADKEKAVNYKYLQYQHPQIAKYICIDFDGIAANILDSSLRPNILVLNKENAKGHGYYRINNFVASTPNSRIKPQKTLRLINHSLINYFTDLEANPDPCFNGQKAKNPLSSDDFRVFSYRQDGFDFDEFFDNIPDQYIYTRKAPVIENKAIVEVTGRNCYLFEKTRKQAYIFKNKSKHFNSFYAAVETFCFRANAELSNPLGFGEVEQIIKSITKWTWNNYTGDTKNRGVMQLDLKGHDLTLQDKQVLGAKYTNETQREDTQAVLKECFDQLQAEGKKATQKAVAELSGKGIATVKRYWKNLK